MKYIRLEDSGFILFHEMVNHTKIAAKFRDENIISAGFADVMCDGQFCCAGKSVGLNIQSLPEDTKALNKQANCKI